MRLRVLLLAAASLSACTVPVQPTAETPDASTWIGGTVELAEADGAGVPGGPTFVFRYDCADPPPPAGTGRPVDFLVIDEAAYTSGRADFVFPQVPPATCATLTGFVDRDRDFDPFVSVANQVTAGDLAISQVTVATDALDPDEDTLAPVADVRLRAETSVPLDRPAFVARGVDGELGATVALGPAPGTTGNTLLTLTATSVSSDAVTAEDPRFTLVFAPDADGNGWPDDHNGDGLPDVVWPRVLFVSADPSDASGLTQDDPPTVLPGVVLPLNPANAVDLDTNFVLTQRLAGLPFDGAAVLPVGQLTVVLPPLVVTDLDTATTAAIEGVEDVLGDYQIVVMNSSGQTWTVPNELAEAEASQGARVTVAEPAEELPARGVVSGTVELGDTPDGNVIVTAFDCADPPPPLGTGSPIDLATLEPSDFSGGGAPFAFDVVPAESCLLITGYVDLDRDFAALYSVTQLPTAGDQLLGTALVETPAASNGLVAPVLDVVVEGGDVVPLEPPSFTAPDATLVRAREVGASQNVFLSLEAASQDGPLLVTEDPVFTVVLAPDADGNGLPDDTNGDSVPDVIWPRVLLLRNDPLDPLGLATAEPPIVLPGVVLPLDPANPADPATNLALQQALAEQPFDGQQTSLQARLRVVVPPLVVTDLATATTSPIESVALTGAAVDGDYTVLVMNSSGQVWQVPNEAVLFGAEDQDVGFVVEPPDPLAPAVGSIEGSVVLDGPPGGDALVFAFSCSDPPPPAGAGSPVDFQILYEEDFVADEAPFRFAGLAPGTCLLLTGFVDRDGDWSGLYSTTNQATAGDLALSSRTVVVPQPGPGSGLVPDVVNQDLSEVQAVPLERPVFSVAGGTTMTVGASPGSTATVSMQIAGQAVDEPLGRASGPPVFTLVFAPDVDGDGLPDDNNGDGLPDVLWPRVLVRKLDATDPAGVAVADEPPVVLPGVVIPLDPADPANPATNYALQHAQAGLPFDGASVFPVSSLGVAVPGLVVTDLASGSTATIESVLASGVEVRGDYQILVMNSSGQTWAVPNELGAFGVSDQDTVFVVE